MSESFFFACVPKYLKVQHSFAKTIKPNTKYRIVLSKGIQKCDQMKQLVRSKIVGGKIDLESPQLFFNIPLYSPTKNIHFTLKLYEEKPNENQTEIASFTIKSGDYIQSYNSKKQMLYHIEAPLKDDLSLSFDLYVQKSKLSLIETLKAKSFLTKVNNEVADDVRSQSSSGKQDLRQGEGYVSPSRRIQRKSGHKGLLRSRKSSECDDVSLSGSGANTPKRLNRQPLLKERSIQSSSKGNSSKISENNNLVKNSGSLLKIGGQKTETKSNEQVDERVYKYRPETNFNSSQNTLSTRKNVLLSSLLQPSSQQNSSQASFSQPVTPRSPTQLHQSGNISLDVSTKSSILPSNQISQESINSPWSSKTDNSEFELKVVSKVSVNQKLQLSRKQKNSRDLHDLPVDSSTFLNDSKYVKEKTVIYTNKAQDEAKKFKKSEPVGKGKVDSSKTIKEQQILEPQLTKPQTIQPLHSTSNNKQISSDQSERLQQIKIRQKTIKGIANQVKQTIKNKDSTILTETTHRQQYSKGIQGGKKIQNQSKNKMLYLAFLVISIFLIYYAMLPTRRT